MDWQFEPILTRFQALVQSLLASLPNVALALVLFLVFWFVAGVARRSVQAVARRAGQPAGIGLVFGRLVSWALLTLGVLVALTVIFPTLTAASLFGALGVSGVAIGFAFKDIFQNLLAGLLLLITRPFRIGDQIVSGEHEGTVEDIQVRATLLRTYDNRRVVIPNSELYTNRVIVNTAYDRRRLAVTVGIGYGDDIAQAKQVILETLSGVEDIRPDPAPTVLVRELADFSVNLEVRYWIDPPIRREVVESQDRVLEALKPALIEAGIDLPLPTQQVLFHDQTEETDGDRSRQREGWPARESNPRPRAALRQAPETP
ncbi:MULTISPECIES: mechanosensitive ion channel family protein [unclassified Deinococcus]|uniref:mechanosensitive ion channel family protein n=1 Tax=unclassified Deinococcus TaxID=2623546 RepID=UPI000C19D0BD|nr:mechanosensitive ion channel family protein [Deinococcus sp. UR1]PIG97592.1 mechanosensitive ion channel protein MscS [Deinococcus sp. UR1]